MKIIEQLERLKAIHDLIEKEQTGTPEEFARKIRVSKRHLYYILDELRLLGAPIRYNTNAKTYIYIRECNIDININIEVLDDDKLLSITGGSFAGISYYIHFN